MIDTAIILAGGRGSRLSPWPAPKCLLPVNGVPILHRLIRHLEDHVRRVVVCTGYRSADVEAALQGFDPCIPIEISRAEVDMPMGARLLRARLEKRVEGRALILYGDELADVDMKQLVFQHERRLSVLTYVAHKYVLPFGVVDECSRIQANHSVLVNIGFVVVEPQCWPFIKVEDGLHDWINTVRDRTREQVVAKKHAILGNESGLVSYYEHMGKRATINSLNDLAKAEELFS